MALSYIEPNTTLKTDGRSDLILTGQDKVTLNAPGAVANHLHVYSAGNNDFTINQGGGPASLTATLYEGGGTLTLHSGLLTGAHLDIHGPGNLHADNLTIGARYGGSHVEIDINNQQSSYRVIDNGSLTFDNMTFLQQADVTLDDLGMPVGNIGGPPPVLAAKGLAAIADVAYSQDSGLRLDWAAGGHTNLSGIHIADSDFYSLTQTAAGDITLQATAAFASSGFEYHQPSAPAGGHVFHV